MAFADRLKELRKAAGLSQPQLAEKSGVKVATLREYEQGRRLPSLAAAQKLKKALGVSCDAFDEPETPKRPRKRKGAP